MEEPRWTLDELAERVDAALAVDYAGQPSGRVRDVPDRRAIRWYTTIGLVDRPPAPRGRTALYGPPPPLQLVAVKRLQAGGLPLVAIQRELAGATDDRLARLARLPATGPPAPGRVVPAAAPAGGADAAPAVAAAPRGARGAGRRGRDPARGPAGGGGDPAAGAGTGAGGGGRRGRARGGPAAAGRAGRPRAGRDRTWKGAPMTSNLPLPLLADEEPAGPGQAGLGVLATDRGNLPLAAVHVDAAITGLVARVVLTQTFGNRFDQPLEASYIFPLPDRAAVTEFRMEVGERVVEGVLKERGQARADYDQAIQEGRRASIAEEERPGVFTMRVGNLLPGERATVRLAMTGPLPWADGEASFRSPRVVAPR